MYKRNEPCGSALVLPSPFQRAGVARLRGLVHIYTPRNRTPRGWGHGVGRPLLLVGLTDSHGSHPQPFGVLGFAIPSLALGYFRVAPSSVSPEDSGTEFHEPSKGVIRAYIAHVGFGLAVALPPEVSLY